ncbi:exopolysaccharide production protein ExoQ [Constrictibacter sp. MBR-5]|jgi:O-antigen ligase|uniref:O-antigen ligase family protein n=1 Tax=Constrictibacter sp. MBR-5 TaxID=3156467 RepID=UPI0033923489
MPVSERRDQGLHDRAARWFAVVGLLLFSEAFFNLAVAPTDRVDDASFLRLVWPPIYLGTLWAITYRPRDIVLAARRNWLMMIVVGLCIASTVWSVDPAISLRRAIALAFTTLFGLWLAVRFTPRERLLLLARTFVIIAIGSVLMALLLPRYGIMQEIHPGAWSGAFPQKNKLGQIMVYGAAVFTIVAVTMPDLRRRAIVGLGLCIALVLLSTSMTSLLGLLLMGAAVLSATVLLRRPVLAVLLIYGSLVSAAVLTISLALDADAVFQMIGRDASMTGRTDIWGPLWERLSTRPWLGFGYSAFWHDPEGPAWAIRRAVQWDVPSAHNGWVELWLDVGIGGVVLFGVGFLVATARAVAGAFREVGTETLWTLVFLTLFLLFSISESSIARQNNLVWVMYVAFTAAYGWRPEPRRLRPLARIVWPERHPGQRAPGQGTSTPLR